MLQSMALPEKPARVFEMNDSADAAFPGAGASDCQESPSLRRRRACRSVVIRLATPAERETIYQLRHDVYAQELGQHAINAEGRLTDALDAFNIYLVAADGDRILGFISVTPPGAGRYSIDKYFRRDQLPFPVDDRLYEIRLLTLLPEARGWFLALGLMWAAFRYIESRGATRFAVIGREEVLSIYFRVGLKLAGLQTQAGAVIYHLMHATMQDVHNTLDDIGRQLGRIEANVRWEVGVPFWTPAPCYHGGEFFKAVGEGFDCLDRRKGIINADVLDAWFPPAPGVLAALERDLPWLVQTSPPTGCEGMVRAIARARGVPVESILPGGGSSDLIFRALRHWLTRESRVLLLDPTYGEYGHVLERVVGCHVDRWPLARAQGYRLDVRQLPERVRGGYHLVVLVNPNSPTGEAVPREELESALGAAPASTRVWVDETYVDYLGPDQSIERFAAHSENVVVCKSMSKVYALSGMRVAYLCAGGHQLEGLRAITPPWVVGLPGQLAAVRALEDPAYYAARWLETHGLRESLAAELRALGWDLFPGSANFLLCHVPADGPDAATWISRCQEHGLWLRSASAMSPLLGDRAIRVAVKDAATNRRMVEILRVVGQGTG